MLTSSIPETVKGSALNCSSRCMERDGIRRMLPMRTLLNDMFKSSRSCSRAFKVARRELE